MAKVIAGIEFEKEVLKSDVPVVVDFFAEWCGPCKMLAPQLEAVSKEMEGRAKVIKVDVDKANDIAITYDIKSVPTLMFFKNGQIVDKIVGFVSKEAMTARLNGII